MNPIVATLLAVASTLALGSPSPTKIGADFDPARWTVQAQDHRVEDFAGQRSLYLDRGIAWLNDVDFGDGVIDVDVALADAVSFVGVTFHDDGNGNREHFYLRPHLSGKPDASQYDAVFNGVSGWQIYVGPRFASPFRLAHDRWMHLRVVVSGTRAAVYLDDQPVFVIPELLHGAVSGRVGLQASGAPAHFANARVRPDDTVTIDGSGAPAEPVADSVVRSWRVSAPFAEADLEGHVSLHGAGVAPSTWTRLSAGERGIANLARTTGIVDGRDTVLAAVTVEADGERVLPVRFGFSDRVRVYLNGRLLFAGDDAYSTRDYRFLGTIGLHDELFLPLRAGSNELTFAVSEGFGGWGVILDVPDRTGVEIHS